MKKLVLKGFVLIAVIFIFLYSAAWFYYRQKGIPRINFSPSIVSIKKTRQLQWIPVHWQQDQISDRSAMYLPVYLDTISKPFWMQFDLGSSVTYLYNISGSFPSFKQKEKRLPQKNESSLNYSGFNVRLGDSLLYRAENIPVLSQQSESLIETDSMYDTKIGDLGYDFIKNRILVIDYRDSKIAITDTLDKWFEKNINWFTAVLINQMPMYLPVTIGGKTNFMQFDNGSSAFTLWTSTEQWNTWRDRQVKPDTFTGQSWGIKEYYYKGNPSVQIQLLDKNLNSMPIWAVDKGISGKKTFLQTIKAFTDKYFGKVFTGCIGNEYFRDEVIIFDVKHNRLGIQQKSK